MIWLLDFSTLLDKLRNGDDKTVTTFYKEFYGRLCYFAFGIIHDMQEARDIGHDVIAKCLFEIQGGRQFDSDQKLKNFLFVSARNKCYSFLRNQSSDWKRPERLDDFPDITELVADIEIVPGEMYDEIYKEIANLSPKEQQVVILSFIKGYRNPEIAAMMNITDKTVRNLKASALQKLRIAFIKKPLLYLILISYCPN